jgi:hypothetical protein
MTDKPPLDDPRWAHHADRVADERHVHQEWRLVDGDGTEHAHVEEWVNRRARTERPPS